MFQYCHAKVIQQNIREVKQRPFISSLDKYRSINIIYKYGHLERFCEM